jgi:hypothetical protein
MHPQHITTPEVLHVELKALAEALELASPAALEPVYHAEDSPKVKQPSPIPSSGLLSPMPSASPIPMREKTMEEELRLRTAVAGPMIAAEAVSASSPGVANVPMQLAAARQAAYANLPTTNEQPHHINLPVLLLIGFVLFALFSGLGWMLAHIILH